MSIEGDREIAYQLCGRNLMLNQEYYDIADLFSEKDIRLIGLKGISLIQEVIDPAERYIGDIDILVRDWDVPKAVELLRELGYSGSETYFNPKDPFSIFLNSLTFTKSYDSTYYIHLHWHILNTTLPLFMYNIDMEDIWSEAESRVIGDREFLFLSPAHRLVYFAFHAFNHSYRKKSLLDDILRLICFYGDRLDWDTVVETAFKWGANVPLYIGLALVQKIYGADTLQGVVGRLMPLKGLKKADKIIDAIGKGSPGTHNMVLPVYLNMAGGLRNEIKFLVLSVFPPYRVLWRVYSLRSKMPAAVYYFLRFFYGLKSLS